jgi:hypothetical protein
MSWGALAMTDARSGLARIFALMSEDELLARWRGGHLTDLAIEAAGGELLRRGIAAPIYVAVPDRPAEAPAEEPREFVEVARALHPGRLEILRARLDSEGIPSFVADAETTRMNALWSIALGGARLLVESRFEAEARELIALLDAGAFALREGEDLG